MRGQPEADPVEEVADALAQMQPVEVSVHPPMELVGHNRRGVALRDVLAEAQQASAPADQLAPGHKRGAPVLAGLVRHCHPRRRRLAHPPRARAHLEALEHVLALLCVQSRAHPRAPRAQEAAPSPVVGDEGLPLVLARVVEHERVQAGAAHACLSLAQRRTQEALVARRVLEPRHHAQPPVHGQGQAVRLGVALRPELELGKGDGRIGRREHTEEGHAATARPSRRCAPDPPQAALSAPFPPSGSCCNCQQEW